MARSKEKGSASNSTATTVGYEAEMWRRMADALRGSMDAAEYKHVVRGLIFLNWGQRRARRCARRRRPAACGRLAIDSPHQLFGLPCRPSWPSLSATRRPSVTETCCPQ